MKHFKAANIQRRLRKILRCFSLILFVVFIIVSFVSNHHAIGHRDYFMENASVRFLFTS